MKRLLKLLATPAMIMAVSLGMLGAQVAPAGAADAGVAQVNGSGTISPGLGAAPAAQSFTFNSTTITITGTVNGSSTCTASGGSIGAENLGAGVGTGTWGCSAGLLAGRGGSLDYVRVGAEVTVAVTGGVTAELNCVFVADQTPPSLVVSYSLTCAGAGSV